MRPKTYRVELTEAERIQLLLLIRQGKTPARALPRAPILPRAAEGGAAGGAAHPPPPADSPGKDAGACAPACAHPPASRRGCIRPRERRCATRESSHGRAGPAAIRTSSP